MTKRTNPVRPQRRFPVSWPVLYGGDEFLAEGTVLDLTQLGWRVAGAMPVVPGTPVTLQVWVPDKLAPVRIQRATVLWVHEHEFAIEAHEMAPSDQAWVTEFLNRKLGPSWTARTADPGASCQPREGPSRGETSSPCVEDTLPRLLATQLPPTDMPAEAHWSGDPDDQDDEVRAGCDRLIEEDGYPALRLLRGMLAKKAAREQRGRDSIADN